MRYLTMVLAMVAGFLGGTIGSRLKTVYAQGPSPGVEIIHSKAFVLLDGAGHKRGEWVLNSSGEPVLRLFDASGRLLWDTAGTPRAQLSTRPQIAK